MRSHNPRRPLCRRNKKMLLVRSQTTTMCSATIAQPGKNVEQRMVNVIDDDVRKLIDYLPEEQREGHHVHYMGMSFARSPNRPT
ncbi:MAG: hypothetical protein H6597_04365 [Flavobacteriales bacterium]|nr:hypothetical protein [Flavobacteriales bacterium]